MTIITYLTHVRFEFGAIAALAEDLRAVGSFRPLLVTDRGVRAAGLIDRLLAAVPEAASWPVYDSTPSNPTEAAVLQALDDYRTGQCDGVIGFGGGSPIDLAKGVALLASHGGRLADYALIEGGLSRIRADVAPVVAIPTTAGTGSEVGRAALITLEDGRKLGIVSPHLIPRRAICDPELTLALPAGLTAATGMDAFSHCIETYLSPRVNPPAEAIALDGAGRIWRNLETAVRDGSDRAARWELMMGALMGGMTFQKGLGAVHGLSHALGGLKSPSLHHGMLNAVLLPPVLRLNAGAAPAKIARIADVLGVPAGTSLDRAVADLNARIGLPASLADRGIDPGVVDTIAERAQADHSTPTNPHPMDVATYRALLLEVLG